jgi:UPF0755 protein
MAIKKGWIGIILLLDVSLMAVVVDSYMNHPIEVPTLIYVPEKSSEEIVSSLSKQEVPLLPIDSLFLERYMPISYGWMRYEENSSISRSKLMEDIQKKKREKTRRLVVYSGDSLSGATEEIARNTRIPKSRLIDVYHRLSPYRDGGILAGFYKIPYRATATAIISYMVELSEDKFRELSNRFLGYYSPSSFRRYLIIASIIQKETWREDEKPLISAVIYNRLNLNIKLQLDATLNYGKYSHKKVTPWRIRHDKSYFNTYKHRGLPPYPLGSVSKSSLIAAFNPAKVKYLYFVRDVFSRHLFASNYLEHLANITKIKVMRAKIRKFKRYLE